MKPFLPIIPFLAKYPFLRVASRFLEFEYGSIESILNSNEKLINDAKKLGVEIVEYVLEGKIHPELKRIEELKPTFICEECEVRECKNRAKDELDRFKYCDYPYHDFDYRLLKLAKTMTIAHLFSKIAVSKLSEAQRRKFAVREARRYREMIEEESLGFLKYLATDFRIRARVVGDEFKVDVVDYLKGAVRIKADAWKLVNRHLENGFVFLTKREFVRLIEEYLRDRLEERVEANVDLSIDVEERWDEEIKDLGIRVECYPPCMKKILSDLKRGVNVPHTARFALASFLLNIGMSVDDVVNVFRNAPDFDEEKTRYQVEHIAGMRGKGEEYICPSCDTMRSYGNCYSDDSCSGIGHPIKYYRRCITRTCSR